MKVGTLAYTTNQGLGILVKDFYDNGMVTDVLIVKHGRRESHNEWYPNATVLNSLRGSSREVAQAFVDEMDVMLFFETPFIWELIPFCREQGIKTFLMPMYECMPKELPYQPDRFICPSILDLDYFPERSTFIPVPVDVEWRQRTEAKVFVHNAGNLGLRGRNGTRELIEALDHIESDAKVIIRSQVSILGDHSSEITDKTSWRIGETIPAEDLYKEGDVFIFPEKFNGLSLPLQEARAAGMLVMGVDRYPMNTWLPNDPLIPVHQYDRASLSGRMVEFDEAVIRPQNIAKKIDEWYGRDITDYSSAGKSWAEEMSWETLKPTYLKELSQ